MKRILLPSVPSTNDYALELIRSEHAAEWTVVQTLDQTRGRGQGSTRWETEPGANLTLSVILYPRFLEPRAQFRLSQAVSLGVADCVAGCLAGFLSGPEAEPRVKWPNDVLVGERKLAGILIESRISHARVEASVVGIGLNVNQISFPPHLAGAASLRTVTGRAFDTELVLEELIRHLESRYGELREDTASIERAYLGRLYGRGRELRFTAAGESFRGSIQGVDDEGRLLVLETGAEAEPGAGGSAGGTRRVRMRRFSVKEIDYRWAEPSPRET